MTNQATAKPRRKPTNRPTFDRRTRFGKRVADLEKIYADAIGGPLSPATYEKVCVAAQLAAVAEAVRQSFMRGQVTLEDLIRTENRAAGAYKLLGIAAAKPKTETLADYLAGKRAP